MASPQRGYCERRHAPPALRSIGDSGVGLFAYGQGDLLRRHCRRGARMTGSQVGPGWYSDPTRVHELRYFDARSTDFVVNHGVQSVSPMPPAPVWTPSVPAPPGTFAGPVQRVGPGHAPNVPST